MEKEYDKLQNLQALAKGSKSNEVSSQKEMNWGKLSLTLNITFQVSLHHPTSNKFIKVNTI